MGWGEKEKSSIVYVSRPKPDSNGKITIYNNGIIEEAGYVQGDVVLKNVSLGKEENGTAVYDNKGVNTARVVGFENRLTHNLVMTLGSDITEQVMIIKELLYSYGTLSVLNSIVGMLNEHIGHHIRLEAKPGGVTKDGRQSYQWYVVDGKWLYSVDDLRKKKVYNTAGQPKLDDDRKKIDLRKVIDELIEELRKLLESKGMYNYDAELEKHNKIIAAAEEAKKEELDKIPPELRDLGDDVPF